MANLFILIQTVTLKLGNQAQSDDNCSQSMSKKRKFESNAINLKTSSTTIFSNLELKSKSIY